MDEHHKDEGKLLFIYSSIAEGYKVILWYRNFSKKCNDQLLRDSFNIHLKEFNHS